MLFSFFRNCFMWLPTPLFVLVSAIFSVFAMLVLFEVLKIVFDIMKFLKECLSGLIGLVVDFFV